MTTQKHNDKFRKSLKAGITKAKEKTPMFFIRFMLEVDRRLIMKSPVDTGSFKGNWMIGSGVMNTGTTESTARGGFGSFASYNQVSIKALKITGQVIYETNNLPYARRLEFEGWSKQAPMGMVRTTLAEMKTIANQIGLEIKGI